MLELRGEADLTGRRARGDYCFTQKREIGTDRQAKIIASAVPAEPASLCLSAAAAAAAASAASCLPDELIICTYMSLKVCNDR